MRDSLGDLNGGLDETLQREFSRVSDKGKSIPGTQHLKEFYNKPFVCIFSKLTEGEQQPQHH